MPVGIEQRQATMKKILVTGAHGFLGRHAARHFNRQKCFVTGIGHGDWSEREWRTWGLHEWHATEVDVNAMTTYGGEPDVIVHCAGGANVSFAVQHPKQDFERSVTTTLAVLEYVRLHAPRCIVVYPSSAAVYGTVERMPIVEECSLNPVSFYGVNKRICEQLVAGYAGHFGVASSIVRYFSIYGPGLKKQILWDACNRLNADENQFFGTGRETRDFVHVEDAVSLLHAASRNAGPDCPVVNGGTGEKTTISDLLVYIFRALGRSDQPVFIHENREGDPQHYLADASKVLSWGWQPRHSISDGVREYVDWYNSYMSNMSNDSRR